LRKRYQQEVFEGKIGKLREDDERMLWYLCAGSGLKCPTRRENKRRKKYKELHLGDYKFDHRWTNDKKMARKVNKGNFYKWHHLEEDEVWKELTRITCRCDMVSQVLANVREYMNNRKQVQFED
jgi:hypothetical protein